MKIQLMIFEEVLGTSSIVNFYPDEDDPSQRGNLLKLIHICSETRRLLTTERPLLFRGSDQAFMSMDPAKHIFRTHGSKYPKPCYMPLHHLYESKNLQRERKFSADLPFHHILTDFESAHTVRFWNNNLFPGSELFLDPLGKLPLLDGISPTLETFTSTFYQVDKEWCLNALSYPESLDRAQNTGITWRIKWKGARDPKLPKSTTIKSEDNVDPHADLKVGLIGFSRVGISLGGFWAGFRYYEETGKVEFSPLAWHEVKTETLACRRQLSDDESDVCLPPMVLKIFIVRAGQRPWPQEPHHSWTEVTHTLGETATEAEVKNRVTVISLWKQAVSGWNSIIWSKDRLVGPTGRLLGISGPDEA